LSTEKRGDGTTTRRWFCLSGEDGRVFERRRSRRHVLVARGGRTNSKPLRGKERRASGYTQNARGKIIDTPCARRRGVRHCRRSTWRRVRALGGGGMRTKPRRLRRKTEVHKPLRGGCKKKGANQFALERKGIESAVLRRKTSVKGNLDLSMISRGGREVKRDQDSLVVGIGKRNQNNCRR